MSIFSDIKVLDLTKVFSGPFATRMLADYGEEVLKIENDENPDDSRQFPPLKNGWSGYYEILNRNKKGIALNLKDEKDLNTFYQLVTKADIIVENFTPSTKHKLKIDYNTVKEFNPSIIYASLSGIGQQSDRKYYDVIAQAESGLMSLTGFEGSPMKIGPSIVDAFSGMTLAFALASALFYKAKTGQGQYLDLSMLGCSINLLEANLIDYSITKKNPKRTGNQDNAIAPFGVFSTQDGQVVLAIGNNTLWNTLALFLSEHTSFNQSLFATNHFRLKNIDELTNLIETVFSHFKSEELSDILTQMGIPCSMVFTMKEVYQNRNLYKSGELVTFKHPQLGECVIPGKPIHFSVDFEKIFQKAPDVGENNHEYGL